MIHNLDSKKAPGLNKISNKLLKYVYVSIKPFLLKLFSNSLEHGCYPENFKTALVTMLHKTGKPKNKGLSYRPLRLTACAEKILKKLLSNRIKKWAKNNNIFNLQQNGFWRNRSTNDNLLKITQSIRQNINKSTISTVVFFDVEKAFDQVRHKGLLTKLYELGFNINLIKWIKSFLQNRGLTVKLNNIFSELLRPIHGVSPGSPLSPILFILYVSDIPQLNHKFTFLSQFADDFAIWASEKDFLITNNRLQPYLDKLNKWCKVWRIRLNPGKTK